MPPRLTFASLLLLALLSAAYSNHFHNSFHFDDAHTIESNVHIRNLSNIPKFFTDAHTFSNLPTHQVYRPLLTTTLALDWSLGQGNTLPFHITTFVFFLILLATIYLLYTRLTTPWIAYFATAVFALHPVIAETLNYIIQRADLLSTLGVTASLLLYIAKPAWRNYYLYLIPVTLGLLTKPPALIFPVILIAWIALFETPRGPLQILRAALPAILHSAAMGLFLSSMTAASFNPGGTSPWLYRITQGWVTLYYFASFFAPLHLSADSDWRAFDSPTDPKALAGLAFLAALIAAIAFTRRHAPTRPIAFGLIWFLAALFPTAWMPLAEVANDHRMFFPFIGLAIAAVSALHLTIDKFRLPAKPIAALACLILVTEAAATYHRNQVWLSEETLWRDVTIQSPNNGRGLMNYALTLMAKNDQTGALAYLERARLLNPNYAFLEINLGVNKGELGRAAEAEKHFLRALQLEPNRYESHFFYARWLLTQSRQSDAIDHLRAAVSANPYAADARHLLMTTYAALHQWPDFDALTAETLRLIPNDPETLRLQATPRTSPTAATPESLLELSLIHYRANRFDQCIETARQALKINPNYAEAWNNIAAAYNAQRNFAAGIAAADHALRLKPDFPLARNNRAWAVSQLEPNK